MEWSFNFPSESGYYWYRYRSKDGLFSTEYMASIKVHARTAITIITDGETAWLPDWVAARTRETMCLLEWYGPLEVPE